VSNRPYDLALLGATGFTGQLTAAYLAEHGPPGLKVLLVGRNLAKLEKVQAGLRNRENFFLAQADVGDPASLIKAISQARVLITTVGPFDQYGEPVVAACVEAGTDYVDITGEPQFVDRMILRYGAAAEAKGVRIVPCCGFDSIPHDLGVYYTVKLLPEGEPIRIEGFVRAKGGVSGGTYQSAVNAMGKAKEVQAVRKERRRAEVPLIGRKVGSLYPKLHYEPRIKAWAVPFPSIDPDVIARSARTLERYGPDFRYAHYLSVKKASTMATLVGGVGVVFALAQLAPTRRLLLKLKSSGEGPDEATRAAGRFEVRFFAQAGGTALVTRVHGGEPGYSETAKMLGESALCLAFDRERLPARAGLLTTATAMGDPLIERLQKAGITFEQVRS
jgi:short subunit dehydrogenase-like uncharacterized protein